MGPDDHVHYGFDGSKSWDAPSGATFRNGESFTFTYEGTI
jgi:hypothetical protein